MYVVTVGRLCVGEEEIERLSTWEPVRVVVQRSWSTGNIISA